MKIEKPGLYRDGSDNVVCISRRAVHGGDFLLWRGYYIKSSDLTDTMLYTEKGNRYTPFKIVSPVELKLIEEITDPVLKALYDIND